jgi:alkylated DNA repair protein alkB family protein 1
MALPDLIACSGLVILPSFASPEKQRQLVRWSLEDQAKHPNNTNLDIHYGLPQDGLWNSFIRARKDPTNDLLIQRRPGKDSDIDAQPSGPRKLIENTPVNLSNFHIISTTPKTCPAGYSAVRPLRSSALMYKLRWANIGWHYHWDSKQYDFSRGKMEIHQDLRRLCKRIVGTIDWQSVFGDQVERDERWGEDDWRMWNGSYGGDLLSDQNKF